MIIAISCDHAGFHLKEVIKKYLSKEGWDVEDMGAPSDDAVDYPDFVHPLASKIHDGILEKGVLICGTGNGVALTANKYEKVRCGLCWNKSIASLVRKHNNANILALPGRFVADKAAIEIVDTFLNTPFEGGRHQRRMDKIPTSKYLCC